MKESHPLPDEVGPYAGFVSRVAAAAIDLGIVAVVLATGTAGTAWVFTTIFGEVPPVVTLGLAAFAIGFPVGYFTLAWAVTGRTVGNALLGLRVADWRGRHPRWFRALLRSALGLLFIAVWVPGMVLVLFDRRRRALHDRVFGTVVLYDDGSPRPADRA